MARGARAARDAEGTSPDDEGCNRHAIHPRQSEAISGARRGPSSHDEGRNQHALRVCRYRRRRETRQTVNGRRIWTDRCGADVDVIRAAWQRVAVEQHPHVVWACMHGAVAHLELGIWARSKPRGGMCGGISMDHAHLPRRCHQSVIRASLGRDQGAYQRAISASLGHHQSAIRAPSGRHQGVIRASSERL